MKPNLPKRLAARIRAAITKVESAQLSVLSYEKRMEEAKERISEYEANPVLFASKNYPGHGVDSYPVMTTMSRTREDLEYRIRRYPAKLQELREYEAALVDVEGSVLAEVRAMRPTNGREMWPVSPKPLEMRRQEFKEENAKDEVYFEREREKQLQIATEIEAEETAKQAEEDEKNLRESSERLAAMSPDERARYEVTVAKIQEAFSSGTLTPMQLISAVMKESQKRNAE